MFLTALIFLPLIFVTIVTVAPSRWAKSVTLIGTLFHFAFSLGLLFFFNPTIFDLQLVEKISWIPRLGISYFLGIDGISLWLVLLSTLLPPLMLLASWKSIDHRVKAFCNSLLLLEMTMLGTFLAIDAVLFYIFFEAALIPMYLLVGIWGGARRIYASLKFFIYTMLGSVFMLLGIIALMLLTQTLDGQLSASLLDFYKLDIPFVGGKIFNMQTLLFAAFSLAFAIKVPLFPLHTWLPDAHVEAPTAGSVALAGVMLKMGTYGFLRFVIPLFPQATNYFANFFLIIGVIGIIYGALVAMAQTDLKKLVAYSSVSHMGYVVIGLFALNIYGITGGLYQMLNHGISTSALFLLVGILYERTHNRNIGDYGGLAVKAPLFTVLFMITTFSSIAVPLTNGFVGEFLILLGTFQAQPVVASFAVLGVVLGATYMLWMIKKVFFGQESDLVKKTPDLDLNFREVGVLAPLVILIFWMGIFPNHFLDWSQSSLNHLQKNRLNYTLQINSQKEVLPVKKGDKDE